MDYSTQLNLYSACEVMVDIFKVVGIGIITCVITIVIKQIKPELAVFVGITGGLIIVLMIASSFLNVVNTFSAIAQKGGVSNGLFKTLLKIIGIGYITEFASNICADAGSNSLGDKMILAGKILILTVAMPVVTSILEIVIGLLP